MRRRRGAVLLGLGSAAVLALAACTPDDARPIAGAAASSAGSGGPAHSASSPAATGSPSGDAPVPGADAARPALEEATTPTATTPTATTPAAAKPAAVSARTAPTPTTAKPTTAKPTAAKPTAAKPTTSPRNAATGRPAPGAGNPDGHAAVPAAGRAADTSRPTRVIGTGTAASCTSAAVVAAVAAGGVVTFDCGPAPVTITLRQTAKVVNTHPDLVLDGGGTVTLSGGGARRILYQNTCDQAQAWISARCQDQETPRLVVQNLTFADGDATGDGLGGGAIFVRGGQLKVVNSRFVRNRCEASGPDVGGAALRVLDQYRGRPVYVVGSTFGGAAGQGGRCSNGGGFSSIGVSWVVLNSLFSHNSAIGRGANPARSGTVGGGSGGAIYLDGNRFTLTLRGTRVEDDDANEGGGAVFFVSNDRTGTMTLDASVLRRNPSRGFETQGLPGIFFLGAAPPTVTGGTILAR